MDAITYSKARANLAKTMENVCQDHDPIIITGKNKSVVMISVEDYSSMQETAYLLSNPVNAKILMESIEQLEKGEGKERKLIE
jgi:antitoxin YefM